MHDQETTRRRVLLYEYTCSGGLLGGKATRVDSSLSREGWTMLRALATDLAAISGVHVQVLADHRGLPGPLPNCELIDVHSPTDERELLIRLAASADWTIVIAPETDSALLDRCQWVEACGGRLLGLRSELVELLGDKHRTAEHLSAHGIPCPSGSEWRPDGFEIRLSSPLVIKPVDGAGSQATYLMNDQQSLDALLSDLPIRHPRQRFWKIETFEYGEPVSVAALCGPTGNFLLPPCYQRVKCDKTITYHGGAYPINPGSVDRAACLVRRALETLPGSLGYVGVDIVLGEDPDGSDDCVIEINPRLTTSYVGLRMAARTNLAKAMLNVAAGHSPDLSFNESPLEFDAAGTVRLLASDD